MKFRTEEPIANGFYLIMNEFGDICVSAYRRDDNLGKPWIVRGLPERQSWQSLISAFGKHIHAAPMPDNMCNKNTIIIKGDGTVSWQSVPSRSLEEEINSALPNWVPSTEDVRNYYDPTITERWSEFPWKGPEDYPGQRSFIAHRGMEHEFEVWHQYHDKQLRAKAWEEGHKAATSEPNPYRNPVRRLETK